MVGDLSIAEQQQVSIAKALAGEANILILDEPSAILTDAEIEVLFGVVRRLTESGVSVIYISHRLDELFRIAQDVLVMRDGRTIGTYPIGELSVRKVVELMVGGILTETKHEREIDPEAGPRLELQAWAGAASTTTSTSSSGRARSSVSTGSSARASPRSPTRSTASSTRTPAGSCSTDNPSRLALRGTRNAWGSGCCRRTASNRGCSPSSRSCSTSRPAI